MKKMLLITITVLPLATGAAQAEDRIFECSKIVDRHHPQMDLGNAVTVSHEHVSDAEIYNIDITAYHHRKKIPLVVVFDVATQKLKVNGKPCKAVQHAEDEQEKLYRDRVKACHDRGEPVCADDFEYPRYKGNKEDK